MRSRLTAIPDICCWTVNSPTSVTPSLSSKSYNLCPVVTPATSKSLMRKCTLFIVSSSSILSFTPQPVAETSGREACRQFIAHGLLRVNDCTSCVIRLRVDGFASRRSIGRQRKRATGSISTNSRVMIVVGMGLNKSVNWSVIDACCRLNSDKVTWFQQRDRARSAGATVPSLRRDRACLVL
ncbi:hypothetical protein L1987_20729 [Smallanthus sonchifolius]|uniref:Uncharacterized protein n=1 Tax=Smallanthus sonchifolius TaxID=185202 RepID=A0ACB9IU47_9ASTR|nr:hypothetical protein L1987_20729 [Smallanthus sonchifolius]